MQDSRVPPIPGDRKYFFIFCAVFPSGAHLYKTEDDKNGVQTPRAGINHYLCTMDKKLRVTLNVRIQHPGSGMPRQEFCGRLRTAAATTTSKTLIYQ